MGSRDVVLYFKKLLPIWISFLESEYLRDRRLYLQRPSQKMFKLFPLTSETPSHEMTKEETVMFKTM